jgi:hypothetical protein
VRNRVPAAIPANRNRVSRRSNGSSSLRIRGRRAPRGSPPSPHAAAGGSGGWEAKPSCRTCRRLENQRSRADSPAFFFVPQVVGAWGAVGRPPVCTSSQRRLWSSHPSNFHHKVPAVGVCLGNVRICVQRSRPMNERELKSRAREIAASAKRYC